MEALLDSPAYPGDTIRTESTVAEKKIAGGTKYVVVDILVRNQTGTVVARSRAMDSLP